MVLCFYFFKIIVSRGTGAELVCFNGSLRFNYPLLGANCVQTFQKQEYLSYMYLKPWYNFSKGEQVDNVF